MRKLPECSHDRDQLEAPADQPVEANTKPFQGEVDFGAEIHVDKSIDIDVLELAATSADVLLVLLMLSMLQVELLEYLPRQS
jgi:hypothetical protein